MMHTRYHLHITASMAERETMSDKTYCYVQCRSALEHGEALCNTFLFGLAGGERRV